MTLVVNEQIKLELLNVSHAQSIFELASENRNYLREWLPWVDNMHSVEFITQYINASFTKNKEEVEYAFVIKYSNNIVGRIGVYKIDMQNRTGEIGYWIDKKLQGMGIITKSSKVLIDFCFSKLELNRIEIRCAVDNKRSEAVPKKFLFRFEGTLRQAEQVQGKYIDLNLYSMLKKDWKE